MNWTERSEKKNPYSFLDELRPQIMARIKHYENFLADWGIIAQTGIEQEFFVVHKKDSNGKSLHDTSMRGNYFINSPFIERVGFDHLQDFLGNKDFTGNCYEVVIGKGNLVKKKEYPKTSLEPQVIVRVTEKTNQIIEDQANDYNIEQISFDPTEHGIRLYAQQVNISLWDKEKRTPLFNEEGVNELSKICIKNILETQNSLVAAYTVNTNAFKRFSCMKGAYNLPKMISFGVHKDNNPSLLYRMKDDYVLNSESQFGS